MVDDVEMEKASKLETKKRLWDTGASLSRTHKISDTLQELNLDEADSHLLQEEEDESI